MAEFDAIDSWFQKGFAIRRQKAARSLQNQKRDSVRSGGGGSPAKRGATQTGGAKANSTTNVKSILGKAPEVMVKITGSNKGLKSASGHIDYISRNGEVELIDEHGQSINGRAAISDYKQQLHSEGIPKEGNKREFLHVLFSMPKDTQPDKMREAVATFCKEQFSNRRYVMAFHDDTDHKHVHVCVGTRDIDRVDEPRLSPRKGDLQEWREEFAQNLRDRGIDAAASSRSVRFNVHKAEKPVLWQYQTEKIKPGEAGFNIKRSKQRKATVSPIGESPRLTSSSNVLAGRVADLNAALASQTRPANPLQQKLEEKRLSERAAWELVRQILGKGNLSPDITVKDRDVMLKQVDEFIETGHKPISSKLQEMYDVANVTEKTMQNTQEHRDGDEHTI